MDSNVQTITTEMDNIVSTFGSDETTFMELTGQAQTTRTEGLSRLNINYDTETEDGVTLTRGDWKMMYDGEMLYAKTVSIRPILRTFEWSIYDAEQGAFSCKSVQKPTMFLPIRNFIDSLTRQKKIMQKCNIHLKTEKKKKGSVTYWTPVPTLDSETEITNEDKELMKKFADTVKAHNQSVLEQSRESVKLQPNRADDNLANDFNASTA